MLFAKENDTMDPKQNPLYKATIKLFSVDPDVKTPHFFTKIDGKRHITHMFQTLLIIGTTDIIFALDSIPAIIGVKMLLGGFPIASDFFSNNSWFSLVVIFGTLLISILLSKFIPANKI